MKRAKIIKNGHLNIEMIESGEKNKAPVLSDVKSLKSIIEESEEKDKRIKKLEKALKAVLKNFPEEVLQDQMNEDYELIEKALEK